MSDETPIFTDEGLRQQMEMIWARGPVWCWHLDPRDGIRDVVPRLFSPRMSVTYRGRDRDGKEREFEMPIEVLSLPDHDAVVAHAQAHAAETRRQAAINNRASAAVVVPALLAALGLEEEQVEQVKVWIDQAQARRGEA